MNPDPACLRLSRRQVLAGSGLALTWGGGAHGAGPVLVLQGSTTFNSEVLEGHEDGIGKAAGVRLKVVPNKSNLGLMALLDGEADLAMTSAPLSSERELLARARPGAAIDALQEHLVAQTRAVLIVHPDNPLRSISDEAARQVLAGEITNWSALGGSDAPIRLVAAREGGGVITTVSSRFLGAGVPVKAPEQIRVATGPQIVRIVEQEVRALGITDSRLTQGRKVAELATREPIRQSLFIVSRGAPTERMMAVIAACRIVAEAGAGAGPM